MEKYSKLKEAVLNSKHLIFFGGAGVSTESGIPDFRGTNGLYTNADEFDDDPEYLLSRSCLSLEPKKFYNYYRKAILHPEAKPNPAHIALAELEKRGILKAIITQNIDGLHNAAGSRKVLELHGSIERCYCARCKTKYSPEEILKADIPRCRCGGLIRPDVVLYGEGLDQNICEEAQYEVDSADVMIAAGTSLRVWPAASYVAGFKGRLFIINYDETPFDSYAESIIRDSVAVVLPSLIFD